MSFFSDIVQVVKSVFTAEMSKVRTNTVCRIVSYDEDTNLASIQPCIQLIQSDNTETPVVDLPMVEDVPVFQFGTGLAFMTAPPAVDSYGLYLVSDRKLDNWLLKGETQPPGSKVKFDLSNGFLLHGIFPLVVDGNNAQIDDDIRTDRIEMRTRRGNDFIALHHSGSHIALQAGTVDLGNEGATEPVIKGDELNTWLTTSLSVSTAFGPSGPSVVPLSSDTKSARVKVH